jgi:hypothetical protein
MLRAFNISIQTEAGRRPGRLRCCLRAVVAFAPFILTTLTGMRSSQTVNTLLVGAAFAGWLYGIVKRERGIPDIVARTHLVPR